MLSVDRVIDISVLLGKESLRYPGDLPFSRDSAGSIAAGDMCNLSELHLSAHCGTHIDAPAHFMEEGRTIDHYSARDFIFTALIMDKRGSGPVRAEDVAAAQVLPGEALLFRTENSTSRRCCNGIYTEKYVYLTEQAALLCVEKGVGLVGIDYISVESPENFDFPVHRTLLGSDILILEGLDLAAVQPGRYTLVCLPLKIEDAEAAPVRAILLGKGSVY